MTPEFTPQFPGTCPYITAVGGTQAVDPEIAWVASSGGFSNYFTRPQYQAAKVDDYLDNHISDETLTYFSPYFNITGRGFPDISAHSLTPKYVHFLSCYILYSQSIRFSNRVVSNKSPTVMPL